MGVWYGHTWLFASVINMQTNHLPQ